jgi:trimeric autotransporter adhesin
MYLRFLSPVNKTVSRAKRSAALGAALLLCTTTLVDSAPPPAGTSIGNQASATYTDASNTPRSTTSNVAITIVQQVASFTLTADGARFAAPGGQVFFPHTVVNTGNGADTFNLSVANNASGDNFDLASLALYADANGDGLPDNATAINTTGPLAAGANFRFVALGIVPASETAGRIALITVTASGTATATPAPAQSNTDTTTVTGNAVVNVTKALSANSGPPGSGPHTVTLTYNNVGNSTATNLTLRDLLPAGMNYVPNSARWSVTGGIQLTDASNTDAQGAGSDTIIYDFSVSVPGRVTAVIARVVPGQSGTLTFQVTIAAGTQAGVLQNTANYGYDPGTGSPVGPFDSNTADFTVTQGVSLTLTGQIIASAPQGGTVIFTNVVQNTGNGIDTFDITMANLTFPAGTTFNLFQSDANTPLVDSTGNGIPDTGPLAPNQTYQVIVRATLPGGTAGVGPYTARKTARSRVDNTVSATADDVLTTISTSTVDVTANAPLPGGAGVGPGPEGAAVVSNIGSPGTTTRFTLYVNNTSTAADSYALSASSDSTFATVSLPAGWSVVFRNAGNAVITSTGIIPAAGNSLVYADVTIPPTAAPGPTQIYFRGLSPTTTASDVLHAAVIINAARNLTLIPNNSGTVFPGGAVVYSHLLVNNGNVVEGSGGSTVNLSLSHSQVGWSSIIYYDADNDGTAGPTDPAVTDLSFVSGSAAGIDPGESIRLFVKVFAPPGVALGTIDAASFTATTVNGTYSTPVPPPTTATDTTTVISGDVTMIKEQALDADLDGNPEGAYSTAQITIGALPGRAIRYRITVTNVGTAPATSVRVFDTTPAYTTYAALPIPAATTIGTVVTAPANGVNGPLEFDLGTLNPGQSAVITFGVIITQ